MKPDYFVVRGPPPPPRADPSKAASEIEAAYDYPKEIKVCPIPLPAPRLEQLVSAHAP